MKWFLRTVVLATVLAIVAGIGWNFGREYLRQRSVQRAHDALARRISLHEFAGQDQSLPAVLRKLAKQCDVQIVHAKQPRDILGWNVDVPDAELPLETALRVILRQCELAAIPYHGKILILPAQEARTNKYPQSHPLPLSGPEGLLDLEPQAWQRLITGHWEDESHLSQRDYLRMMRTRGGSSDFFNIVSDEDAISDQLLLLPGALVINEGPEKQRRLATLLQRLTEAASPEGRQLSGTRFAGVPLADRPLFEALEKPVSVKFDNILLTEVLATLSERQNVPVFLHYQSLAHNGIPGGWRVTYSAKNLPLRKVLEEILEPHELSYFVQDEMIQVAMPGLVDPAGVYDVSDLLRLASSSPAELQELIASHCGSSQLGPIQVFKPGWLITTQVDTDHRRIARLLAQLRQGLMPQAAPSLVVPVPWSLPEEEALPEEDEVAPNSLVLDLRELHRGATPEDEQRDVQDFLEFLGDRNGLVSHVIPPRQFGHLLIIWGDPAQQESVKNLIAVLARRRREVPHWKFPIPSEKLAPLWLNVAERDAALAKRLAVEIDVDLPVQALQAAVEKLAEQNGLRLVFGMEHLQPEAIYLQEPVSLQLKSVPMYVALQKLLHPRQLDFFVRDGQIVVSTDERAERRSWHRVYPMADLLAGPAKMKIDGVMSAISSFSWIADEGQVYGGNAEIAPVPGSDLLCVSQTLAGHLRLERLLNLVRTLPAAKGSELSSAETSISGITFEAISAAPLFVKQPKYLVAELDSLLNEGAGLLSVQGVRRDDRQIAILGETVVVQGNSVHRERVRQLMEYLLRWHEILPRAADVFEKRDPVAAQKTLASLAGAADPAERAHLAFLLRFTTHPPRTSWGELAELQKKWAPDEKLGLATPTSEPISEQLGLAMLSWAINPATSLDDLCTECKHNRSSALQLGILYRIRQQHPRESGSYGEAEWIPRNWSQDAKDFAIGFRYASNPELPKFLYDLASPPPEKESDDEQPARRGPPRRYRFPTTIYSF